MIDQSALAEAIAGDNNQTRANSFIRWVEDLFTTLGFFCTMFAYPMVIVPLCELW